MLTPYQTHIGSFARKSTFFWAAVGATVGLANVWQFPYLASLHGGGLFVLLYLGCLLLITLPLMVAEAALGRYARHGIVLAMDGFIRNTKVSRAWMLAGRLSVIAAFLVLSFTAVFGSIALAYIFFGAFGRFTDTSPADAGNILGSLVSEPNNYRIFMSWHALFLILLIWVSVQGVVDGLERTFRVVVPGILLLMLALFTLASWHGQLDGAVRHILEMRPQDVTLASLKAALFHAFFTLGLGMGVWTILGAYTAPQTRLKRSILAAVLMDTLIAILAGLMIFAVATDSNSFDGERGFGLLFVSLPVTLAQLPGSQFIIAGVFLLVVMIVWTTSLALMEPVVGWLREWTGAPRGWSALLVGVAVWAAGLVSLLSFNVWATDRFAGATVFRWLELVTGGLLIPVVAILLALFAGWCLTRTLLSGVLGKTPRLFLSVWYWVIRLVLPPVIAFIGIQYLVSSLASLCDNGSGAAWCRSGAPMFSEVEEAGKQEAATEAPARAGVSGLKKEQGVSRPNEQGQAAPSEQGGVPAEPEAGGNTPGGEDILYHSA